MSRVCRAISSPLGEGMARTALRAIDRKEDDAPAIADRWCRGEWSQGLGYVQDDARVHGSCRRFERATECSGVVTKST